MSPVEQTVKYATTVGSLPDAWSFVMARIDELGEAPSVTISPLWRVRDDGEVRMFEVAVSGMREVA